MESIPHTEVIHARVAVDRKDLLSRFHESVPMQAIGHTPLVEMAGPLANDCQVFAKIEGLNLGGSIKDRIAARMIQDAILSDAIDDSTTIIESSSGNTAVGLAQICAALHLRFISVVDARASKTNLALLRAYGAILDLVTEPDKSGEYLPARLERVRTLLSETPNSYWPDQYSNDSVLRAHKEGTFAEIADTLARPPDYLYIATSTCGTLLACSDFIRESGWQTRLIAVDVEGSQIFSPQARRPRRFPGMGAAFPPPFTSRARPWRVMTVTEQQCEEACIELARNHGLLVGASSGAVWAACKDLTRTSPPASSHVLVMPDRGERYMELMSRAFEGE